MFRDNLKSMVESAEGGIAGLLMGFDGIAVEHYSKGTLDINSVGMEFSYILSLVSKAAENLEAGKIQEVAIRTDRIVILIRVLSPEYFVALAIQASASFGKGRYFLRTTAPKLQAEL